MARRVEGAIMPRLRLTPATPADAREAIPFPKAPLKVESAAPQHERALSAVNRVSRKLDDLAKQLNCLGFFDEADPNRPRAA
jgi:hypothetical protein